MIDHGILDKKLKAYKFGDGIRKCIRSYLKLRTQSVVIRGRKRIGEKVRILY